MIDYPENVMHEHTHTKMNEHRTVCTMLIGFVDPMQSQFTYYANIYIYTDILRAYPVAVCTL